MKQVAHKNPAAFKFECQCGKQYNTKNGFNKHKRKGCKISLTGESVKKISEEFGDSLGTLNTTLLVRRLISLTSKDGSLGSTWANDDHSTKNGSATSNSSCLLSEYNEGSS